MDVGTASIAINKLMGIVSVVAGGKTPESISGALSNNPFNANQDLNKQLNLAKLNSLFRVNGNMITLQQDVIVEPLLIISESAFDSPMCDKICNMMLDTFANHYVSSFQTLQNIYGLDAHTIITVLGTDNGFSKLKGIAIDKAINYAANALIETLAKESGLSNTYDDLLALMPENEEEVNNESAFNNTMDSYLPNGKRVRMVGASTQPAAVKSAKEGIIGVMPLERQIVISIKANVATTSRHNPSNVAGRLKEKEDRDEVNEMYPEIKIPVTIKARLLKVTTENIAQVSEPHKKFNMLTTWLDYKSGMKPLMDYLLQTDAVKKYKKGLLKGNEFLKIINERKLSAYSKVASTSVVGFELNYTLLAITNRDKQMLDRYLDLNIFKEEDKNDFMQSIYSLMGVVLDDNSEMATFLTPIVRGINSVTYRELKNVGGKKDVDVTELLGVLVKSKMLG